MSPNIPRNVAKQSGECPQTFRGMSPNILENVAKYSGECRQTFWGVSPNIPGNVLKKNNNLGHVVKHPVERMKAFR